MRVLHIGKFFPPFAGGMEYFLADLLGSLTQRGIPSAALVHDHRRHLGGQIPTDPGHSPLIYRAPCFGRWLYAPISPSFPFWLARCIRDFQPDILHLHMPNTSAFWALGLPAARRIPWVIHWHADVVSSVLDRRLALAYHLYRPLEQRLLAASQAIVVTSPPYLQSSLALERWRQRCRVIPLGIDSERIPEPDEDTLGRIAPLWNRAPFKLLAIGRLTYYKGFEVLIRAVSGLTDLHVLIVGQGERRDTLDQLIDTLDLRDRVTLTGHLSDAEIAGLWRTCDAFCLPSIERTEAFGLVLLEAMRFGKPVIASDIPGSGVGWVVAQGRHGLRVEPNDPAALRAAIQRLKEQPGLRLRLGQAGGAALGRQFHINQVAGQMLHLYRDLYDSTHRTGSARKTSARA